MGARRLLSDAELRGIADGVAKLPRRGPRTDDRRFVEAVVWILRTGAPWRDVPQAFGAWNSIYRRYRRWARAGRWDALHRGLRGELPKATRLLIDSTIVKAHPHAAGASKKGEVNPLRGSGVRAVGSLRRCMPSYRSAESSFAMSSLGAR
jgi:putative transposase